MRTRDARRKKQRTILGALLGLSCLALVLPSAWLGPLFSLVQIIVPLQHAVGAGADAVSDRLTLPAPMPSAGEVADLRVENTALRNHLAAMQVALDGLEVENARLAGIRSRGLGNGGRLIPARIITDDMHSWRESRLINSGSLRGVRAGAPVMSHRFANYEQLRQAGVVERMAVLLGEALVGEVDEQVGTHTARVRLLSDPDAKLKIQIGRFSERIGEMGASERLFEIVRETSWQVGVGDGRMEIRDIDLEDYKNAVIRVGDTVTSHPASQRAPAALVVGTILEIRPDRRNPLLCIATVRSPVEASELRRVYVYDPG